MLRSEAALDASGVLAGLAGATSMATGVVLTKRWGRQLPLLAATGWQLVAGGLLLVPLTVLVEGPPPSLTTTNLAGHLWLGVVGTAIAYSLWFRGVEGLPVQNVSLLGLLSPLVAAGVGWLVLHHTLTPGQLAGAALVLVALRIGQPRPQVIAGCHTLVGGPDGQHLTGRARTTTAGDVSRARERLSAGGREAALGGVGAHAGASGHCAGDRSAFRGIG